MTIFGGFLVFLALVLLIRTYGQYRRQKVSVHWFFLWAVFWVVVAFVGIAPWTTDVVARVVGVERGADLLLYVSVVMLFYLQYRLMMRQERLRRALTDSVRAMAVLHARVPEPRCHD